MKKISQIETGGRFLYGGIEWVKLYAGDGTVAISAEPVFERAFDENNKNDCSTSKAPTRRNRDRSRKANAPCVSSPPPIRRTKARAQCAS